MDNSPSKGRVCLLEDIHHILVKQDSSEDYTGLHTLRRIIVHSKNVPLKNFEMHLSRIR